MTRSVWSLARERNDDARARRKPTCDLPNRRPKDQISQRLLSRDRVLRQRARRILRTQSRRTGRLPTGRIRHPRKSALRIRMATQRAIAALPQRCAPRSAHIVRCDTRSLQRCRGDAETYVTLCGHADFLSGRPRKPAGRADCLPPSFRGASDGTRTRVYGFAGRCLAAQPHPHKPPPCQLRPLAVDDFARPDHFARQRFDDAIPARIVRRDPGPRLR
jgi:hypothetical protein